MPVGCIPEKMIRGDCDFVATFCVEGSVCAARVLPVRPLRDGPGRWKDVRNLRGIWTRRIRDVE
jgi:hypothetical protein